MSRLNRSLANCVGLRFAREKYVAIPEITKNNGMIHSITNALIRVTTKSGCGFMMCHES